MTFIRFFDDDGRFVLDAYFDKGVIEYDSLTGRVVVPAKGIKIKEDNNDNAYYDDDFGDDEVSGFKEPYYRGEKVLYMTFSKRASKTIHYMI